MIDSLQTLVLNADFRPISVFPLSICTWQEAIKALLMERVQVVSEYEEAVHSPSCTIKIPSVVALKRYVSSAYQTPAMTRYNILLRDKFICQYCGEIHAPRSLTLDHVVPRCRGGLSSWENLVAACYDCNIEKGDKIPGKDYARPMHPPFRPSCKDLQRNSRIVSAYHFHESWQDYL
jgi:5-methylcytosine-specific restriction endonuclease McrA